MATMLKPEIDAAEAEIDRLREGTFVLNLSMGTIRKKAGVKTETVARMAAVLTEEAEENDQSPDAADELKVTKELLKVSEVRDLISQQGATRYLIRNAALPVRILKGGLYTFPATRLDWVEEQIRAAQARIDSLNDALEAKWDDIMRSEEERLGPFGLFDARDYTSVAKIREATKLRFSWLTIDVPTTLGKMNPKVFAAEREKAKAMWREMYSQIRLGHSEVLLGFVTKLRAALKPDAEGKTKVLRQSTIDNLTDFLNGYRLDDVTDFAELRSKVDEVKQIISGVDAEVLRTESRARARVGEQMAKLEADINSIVFEQQRIVRLRE